MASTQYTTVTLPYRNDPSAGSITAQVHFPASAAASSSSSSSGGHPIALVFHAGGFSVGGAYMVPATEISALIELGFIVVCPNYRLAPQVSIYAGALWDSKWCLRWAQHELPAHLLKSHQIRADGSRIVAMGHSAGATLALLVAAEPNGVKAVLDLYGPLQFGNDFWRRPLGAFAGVPKLDEAFVNKVHDGPVPSTSPPMMKDGKPDLSTPRNAWMISALRDGYQMDAAVKDGCWQRVDPITHFHRQYPPTMIVHGTADVFAPRETSLVAYARLREMGVKAEMVDVEGAAHVFDFALTKDDPLFQGPVMKGLRFLAQQVGL